MFFGYMATVCPGCDYGRLSTAAGSDGVPYLWKTDPAFLNGKGGCARCGCDQCGHCTLVEGPNGKYWSGICPNCGRKSVVQKVRESVGKQIRFKGTHASERNKATFGKPVEGEGLLLSEHKGHGYCIIVQGKTEWFCVDPTELEVIG